MAIVERQLFIFEDIGYLSKIIVFPVIGYRYKSMYTAKNKFIDDMQMAANTCIQPRISSYSNYVSSKIRVYEKKL